MGNRFETFLEILQERNLFSYLRRIEANDDQFADHPLYAKQEKEEETIERENFNFLTSSRKVEKFLLINPKIVKTLIIWHKNGIFLFLEVTCLIVYLFLALLKCPSTKKKMQLIILLLSYSYICMYLSFSFSFLQYYYYSCPLDFNGYQKSFIPIL